MARRCDLFCAVVDNFGDIGICWRLARQLVAEHHWQLCLWVDDLISFQMICPQVDATLADQQVFGVRIRHWTSPLPALAAEDRPDLLLDALACTTPDNYLHWLASLQPLPLWLNLEYLSAEAWVEGCHALPSPHPSLPLKKFFFFPGFTDKTGGLLREHGRVEYLHQLSVDTGAQQQFWQRIDQPDAMKYQRKISLFAYSQPAIASWIEFLQQQDQPHLVLVPQGRLADELSQQFPLLASGRFDKGNLSLRLLPFMPQPDYDLLLACCDINFVRGEDSIIRAHWAGKPFIWQIYRQDELAHQQKLRAFLQRFLLQASPEVAESVEAMFWAWDHEQDCVLVWQKYVENLQAIQQHTQDWLAFLTSQQDLASNLVRFVENRLIIPRNFS